MGKVDEQALVGRLSKQLMSELVRIGDVNPAKYNPRTMPALEMRKLEASLKTFGFVEPLVIRRSDMLLIGGHQRLEAYSRILRKQKQDPAAKSVPAILLDDLTDDEAKVLNLALNKIHGQWDFSALADVIRSIRLDGGLDIEVSGFTLPEIEDIGVLMPGLPGTAPPDTDSNAALARKARIFTFEVETEAQAKACRGALERFGMTAPKFASPAFVAMCKAASKLPKPTEPLVLASKARVSRNAQTAKKKKPKPKPKQKTKPSKEAA